MSENRRRRLLIIVAGLLGLTTCAVVAWFLWAGPTINLPMSPEEAIRVMASSAFAGLPDYRQEAYRREAARQVQAMPEEQRRRLFDRLRSDRTLGKGMAELRFNPMQPLIDEYYQKPPADRKAVLDRFIDQMEKFRKEGPAGGGPGPPPGGPPPGGSGTRAQGGPPRGGPPGPGGRPPGPPNAAMMRRGLEHMVQQGNPQHTARMMDFMSHVEQRRAERGLPTR